MRGAAAPAMTGGQALARPSARLIVAFALVTLVLICGGAVLYRYQALSQRNDAREALTAVSLLKVDQISRWQQGRLSDAAVLSQDSDLARHVLGYLSAPTPAGKVALRSRLLPWKDRRAYADAAVADPRGNVVFSLSGDTGPLLPDEAATLHQALRLHRPVLTDLHREPGVPPHLSAVAPLFAPARGMPTPPAPSFCAPKPPATCIRRSSSGLPPAAPPKPCWCGAMATPCYSSMNSATAPTALSNCASP